MPVERPTFSESWYRVAQLRPRLRSTVQIYRQHFRGQMWYVLQDPSNNQFFRLNESAYRFIAMLDGRRTVAQVWRVCNEQLGDDAPTQGEAIQLLGQLYSSNLLQAELPPDAEGLLRRYRQRIKREIQGYLSNFLFIRIPLLDPDRFLDRWVGIFGIIFSWYGLAVWTAMMVMGLYFVAENAGELARRAAAVLDIDNLPLLYLSFVLVKIFHEFGHAFACKKFGRIEGSGGEVHVMGVMFLVFTPLPYVDASSAWAFRRKWHRVIVGAAGMLVELAIAAVAAVVWARTAEGAIAHKIAYNVMFIASVSTLLFNGNPLLRYDGYYILSDLLEIPNLAMRSRSYLYYLVKRYIWAVKQAINPAHTRGERIWFVFYGIASTIYRVFICVVILLFISSKLFILGAVLAVGAVVAWVLVPLGRFVHYLITSSELMRVRPRAIASTVTMLGAIAIGVGMIPAPDRCRIEGVVEPVRLAVVRAETNGFVEDFLPSETPVQPDGPPLLRAVNPQLTVLQKQLLAERRRLVVHRRLAMTKDLAKAQSLAEQIAAVDEQIRRVEQQLSSLTLHAPFAGTWVAPDIEQLKGAYLRRGQKLGMVISLDEVILRATAGQQVAAMLVDENARGNLRLQIRVMGRPEKTFSGRVLRILPAGQQYLPSAALGYAAGGNVQTTTDDQQGRKAVERFFEIHIAPDLGSGVRLLSGQRVVVRFQVSPKPLIAQWWRSLLQMLQRRFYI